MTKLKLSLARLKDVLALYVVATLYLIIIERRLSCLIGQLSNSVNSTYKVWTQYGKRVTPLRTVCTATTRVICRSRWFDD